MWSGYEEETDNRAGQDCNDKDPPGLNLAESAHTTVGSHVDVVAPSEVAQFTAGVAVFILEAQRLVVVVAGNAQVSLRVEFFFVAAQ